MNENRKTPGFAEKLSEEQLDQLLNWLVLHTYSKVADLVAQDAPEGFGIKVSVATIGRFALEHSEEIAELRSIRIEEALRHHQEARAHHNIYFAAEVDDATTNALREQALLLATQGGLTPQDLQRLTRTCLNLRKLQASQPTKTEILVAKQSEDEMNTSVRIDIAQRFGVTHPYDELPPESDTARKIWLRNRVQAMRKATPPSDAQPMAA